MENIFNSPRTSKQSNKQTTRLKPNPKDVQLLFQITQILSALQLKQINCKILEISGCCVEHF